MARSRGWERFLLAGLVAAVLLGTGCEMDSYMNPSVQGRWEVDALTLPILRRLDSIEEPDTEPPNLTPVMPEDLIPEPSEYVIGAGDIITISVYELREPGREAGLRGQINQLGVFRHPILGDIRATGLTAKQLEDRIGRIVQQQGRLREPRVTVLVDSGRQATYRVIAEPGLRSIRPGLYEIFGADFRLLDALAMAGGVPGQISKIYVIRQASLAAEDLEPAEMETAPAPDTGDVLIDILQNGDAGLPAEPQPQRAAPPRSLETGLEDPGAAGAWVNVGGRWVPVQRQEAGAGRPGAAPTAEEMADGAPTLPEVIQRVIEVPFEQLAKGDLRYNVVIRPGDIIRVPAPVGGSVFLMGEISRPGTYGLPGDERLTLKLLIAAAGGFGATAIPERVDITRRINRDYEATIRLNLREIFHGNEPDIYLKSDDLINVGTNLLATPLAVLRSGFRTSYGFGFILDRNFGPEVFGANPRNNN